MLTCSILGNRGLRSQQAEVAEPEQGSRQGWETVLSWRGWGALGPVLHHPEPASSSFCPHRGCRAAGTPAPKRTQCVDGLVRDAGLAHQAPSLREGRLCAPWGSGAPAWWGPEWGSRLCVHGGAGIAGALGGCSMQTAPRKRKVPAETLAGGVFQNQDRSPVTPCGGCFCSSGSFGGWEDSRDVAPLPSSFIYVVLPCVVLRAPHGTTLDAHPPPIFFFNS